MCWITWLTVSLFLTTNCTPCLSSSSWLIKHRAWGSWKSMPEWWPHLGDMDKRGLTLMKWPQVKSEKTQGNGIYSTASRNWVSSLKATQLAWSNSTLPFSNMAFYVVLLNKTLVIFMYFNSHAISLLAEQFPFSVLINSEEDKWILWLYTQE